MIKAIDHRKIDITEEEYKFYQKLIKMHTDDSNKGTDYFKDLFETDDDGIITIIKPVKSIPWAVLFFVQNVMINQKLRSNDQRLDAIEKRLQKRTQ